MFLKDVPEQMLYHLMKYIYCGEVNVNREHLDEFLNTAKSLQVKGLIDDPNQRFAVDQSTNLSYPATKIAPKPTIHGFQYQSTSASIRSQTPANMNTTTFSIHPATRFYEHQRDTVDENDVSETKADTRISDEIYQEDQFDDIQNDLTFEPVKDKDSSEKCTKRKIGAETGALERKKVKRNDGKSDLIYFIGDAGSCVKFVLILIIGHFTALSDYDIVPDIRSMASGRKSLFYDDHKFYAQQNKGKKTRWLCTRHATQKCTAIMSTTDVDGKTMMKIVRAEHTHQAQK